MSGRSQATWSGRLAAFRLGLALACAIAGPGAAAAQQTHVSFDHITIEDGLSQSSVNCIVQDRDGFMWFGTQDGLNRFDGYEFRVFDGKNDSLTRPWVWSLLEDREGMLWIGSAGGGLNRWNPVTETFSAYLHDPSDPFSLSDDIVRALFEDRQGRLWVGTKSGLDRFDPSTGTFSRFSPSPRHGTLGSAEIRSILEDSRGHLWVATYGGGLNRLDPKTGEVTLFKHDPNDPRSLSEDRVRSLFEDSDGALWVGTYEAGLNRLHAATDSFDRFAHAPEDPTSLSDNRVRAILQDQSGFLWVGTDAGLNRFRPETGGFTRYRHSPGSPSSLNDNRVMSIFQDRGGVLWVGTQGGINRWNPSTGSFESFSRDPAAPWTLSSDDIQAFEESSDGLLWVGTYEGLNRVDRKTGRIRHYLANPSEPGSLRDERVFSLLTDGNRYVWVGTFEGGLHRLDRRTDRFTVFNHDPNDPQSLSSDRVSALLRDSDGRLWVGTYGGGLNALDAAQQRFAHYRHDPNDPQSLGSDNVVALYEDSHGTLWVGTNGGGLTGLSADRNEIFTLRHDENDALGLSTDSIWAFHEGEDGTLWIGTRSAGLLSWTLEDRNARRGIFARYTTEDGLPNSVINAIEGDAAGNLWISTNDGLSRFDPERGNFRNYDESHGLLSREFNFGTSLRLASGEMLFGGITGFNAFFPSRIHNNDNLPPVVVTKILKLDKELESDRAMHLIEEIELTHRDPMVSFEFAALDYTAPERNRFEYMLEGFDSDWREQASGIRRATYTNLDPGDYVFRVRASNNDGLWNENGAQVRVRVIPSPWASWWAYTLYVLALAGLALTYVRAQQRRYQQKAEYSHELEREVQARTSELADRNRELEQANIKLQLASITDSLTGLRNRRYLATSIEKDIALVDRYHADLLERGVDRTLSRPDYLFLVFDLDGFKEVNDAFGHAAGDRVLVQVREILESVCRKSDTLIRWGGDEFLVVGRYTDRRAAEHLSDRILSKMGRYHFDLGNGQKIQLSCSLGFAYYPFVADAPGHLNWEQVLVVADRALYIAKHSGRNAWVGIYDTDTTCEMNSEELIQRINDNVEGLVSDGHIRLKTSISDDASLVWAWA